MDHSKRVNWAGQRNAEQEDWTSHALEHNIWNGGYDRLSECSCFLLGCNGQFPAFCGKQKRRPDLAHWENEGRLFGYYY